MMKNPLEIFLDFLQDMSTLQIIIMISMLYGGVHFGVKYYKGHTEQAFFARAIAAGDGFEKTGVPSNCKDKKKCIVVYIAPWCGVCTASQPTFLAFNKFLPKLRPDTGFGIVVGAASPNENAKKKNELSPIETHADDSGQLMKARGIRSFPTWVVNDNKGKILLKQPGGFQVINEEGVEAALKQVLKM